MRYLCNDTVMLSPFFSKKKNITVRVTLKSENIKEPQEVRIYSFFPLNNFHYPRSDMMEQVHRTLSTQSTGWLIMYTSFLSFRSTEQTYPNDHSQNKEQYTQSQRVAMVHAFLSQEGKASHRKLHCITRHVYVPNKV